MFEKSKSKLKKHKNYHLNRERTEMFKVFSPNFKEDELLGNILEFFKDYLKTSGESVDDFAKGLKNE